MLYRATSRLERQPASRSLAVYPASEYFTGIRAPQLGLTNIARDRACSHAAPCSTACSDLDKNMGLHDGLDRCARSGPIAKQNRFSPRPRSHQCHPATGEQSAQDPSFFTFGVADSSPISEFRDDFHRKMLTNEPPLYWVVHSWPNAHIRRLAFDRDKARYRKATHDALFGSRCRFRRHDNAEQPDNNEKE